MFSTTGPEKTSTTYGSIIISTISSTKHTTNKPTSITSKGNVTHIFCQLNFFGELGISYNYNILPTSLGGLGQSDYCSVN